MSISVLPYYLVCDESGSMNGASIEAMNSGLRELHQEIAHNPVVANKIHFSVIGFSNDAEVLVPLTDLSQLSALPVLSAKAGTSFAAAFRCVRERIELEVTNLKDQGFQVYRPVVFFLTDGSPDAEDWKSEWQALTSPSFRYRPNIVALGVGEVDRNTISALATFRALVADGSVSLAQVIHEFAVALIRSIVRSVPERVDSSLTLQVPDDPPGFERIRVDPV